LTILLPVVYWGMKKATEYEVNELLTIGPIVITECGEENMYFTLADGSTGFCKAF